jgi:hypothetical protein
VHYSHKGTIERDEIGEAWLELLKMEVFTKLKYNLLSDYRGGTFLFNASELDAIDSFLDSIKSILKGKKNAVIVDNPSDAAISFLFEHQKNKEIDFQVKTFSTESAAFRYLQ